MVRGRFWGSGENEYNSLSGLLYKYFFYFFFFTSAIIELSSRYSPPPPPPLPPVTTRVRPEIRVPQFENRWFSRFLFDLMFVVA